MTRRGKIARLPLEVRQRLNVRLRDGEKGESALAWLNGLPEVRGILEREFGGAAINHVNLTAWRQGGYGDWLREQELQEAAKSLEEVAAEQGGRTNEAEVNRGLAGILSVELARSAQMLLWKSGDKMERWNRLVRLLGELNTLRRADYAAAALDLRLRKARFELMGVDTDAGPVSIEALEAELLQKSKQFKVI